jgi:hypothetical protein
MRGEWNAELVSNYGRNVSDGDSFFGDGVVPRIGLATLDGQAKGGGGIAYMDGWPALSPVSYVGRDSLRTCDRNERRYEVSVAVAMNDSEANQRNPCAVSCGGGRSALRDAWVAPVACDVFFARNAWHLERERSGRDHQKPLGTGDRGAQRLDCTPVHFAAFHPVREVELEGCVDHGVRGECAAPKPFEIPEIAWLHLRTHRAKLLRRGLRPGKANHPMPCTQELENELISNETSPPGHEYAHVVRCLSVDLRRPGEPSASPLPTKE